MKSAIKSVLRPSSRRSHKRQRASDQCGKHCGFYCTLHAGFSFCKGQPCGIMCGAPYYHQYRTIPSSMLGGNRASIENWIGYTRLCKCAQSQQTAIADPTSRIFTLVAGPRQMQGRFQLHAFADDLALL